MDRLPTLGPRGEGWVVLQGILGVIAAAAGVAGLASPPWDGAPRAATTLAGVVLGCLGALQVWRGVRDLGRNVTPLPHPTAGATLVETGVYRRVRHPIYGGVMLVAAGWGLLTAAPVALAVAAVFVPFFWLKSTVEERWLDQRFPGYAAYRRRTHRFIAFPG
ncbi:MAG TPA: isoprenylcysteine carboxylmethyltransferase family protein [Clostridia bacterium]|nr:isoprenylcysteine carboxylmethyltransferase family protein [Clostridia bacterium]